MNDQLTVDDLSNLQKILEGLGYNKVADASIAAVKGAARNLMSNIKG